MVFLSLLLLSLSLSISISDLPAMRSNSVKKVAHNWSHSVLRCKGKNDFPKCYFFWFRKLHRFYPPAYRNSEVLLFLRNFDSDAQPWNNQGNVFKIQNQLKCSMDGFCSDPSRICLIRWIKCKLIKIGCLPRWFSVKKPKNEVLKF